MDEPERNWCSTPLKTSPSSSRHRSHQVNQVNNSYVGGGGGSGQYADNIRQLQESVSVLALENEELKFELRQLRQRCHELGEENRQLHQTVQNQHDIQAKMKKQLNTVTRTAYIIYEKFKSLKSRYYEEHFNADVDTGPDADADAGGDG